ncbi:MAG: phosphodiester glycosidase family protein [Limnochordales bacterium]|nr:phosphodiester glycosidase family protein [Limnochordales bacterium]
MSWVRSFFSLCFYPAAWGRVRKHLYVAFLVALTAAVLAASSVIPGAGLAASDTTDLWPARPVQQFAGWQLSESWVIPVAPGVTHVEERFVNKTGGRLVVHRLQVNLEEPTVRIRLSLPRGEVLPLETVSSRARRESTPEAPVVAAINGDFYTVTPPFAGLPIGFAVRQGELVNTGVGGWRAVGFWADGRVDIDSLGMLGYVEIFDEGDEEEESRIRLSLDSVNRPRGASGLALFTRTYGPGTLADPNGLDVVVKADNLPLRPGVPLTGTIVAVIPDQRNTSIPADGFVLSAAGYSRSQLEAVAAVGKRVKVTVHLVGLESRKSWDDVSEIVGGSPRLVVDGEVSSERHSSLPWNNREPRTAVGFRGKTVFFVTWDGRQPGWSVGATMQEQAEYFLALGAEEALNLDGGGSTTFVVRQPGTSLATVVNRPSDGWERSTSNSLQVVSLAQSDGTLAQLLVMPQEARVMPGAVVQFETIPLDAAGRKAGVEGPIEWEVRPAEAGRVDGDGTFVAGQTDALVVARARAVADKVVEVVEGQAQVTVVQTPVRLELLPSSISVDPGWEVELNLVAYDEFGRRVYVPSDQLEWQVEGDAGRFDPHTRTFVADDTNGVSTVRVKLGESEASATISVGQPPFLIEDFEDVSDLRAESARANLVRVGQGRQPSDPVRFGTGSGRLEYDFTGQPSTSGAYMVLRTPRELPGYPRRIGVWVYGDGQGHWLRAQLRDGSGAFFWIDLTTANPGVNWTGWRYVEAEIPSGKPLPLKFEALRLMETKPELKNRGVVYFDNLRAIYSDTAEDLEGPRVELIQPQNLASSAQPATLAFRLVITDDGEPAAGVDWQSLKVLLDGREIVPGFDPDSGIVTFQVVEPLAAGAHELVVLVQDRAGNPPEEATRWSFVVE